MNRLSLRNNRLKLETAGKLPIILEEFYRIYPNLIKEIRRMSTTCNRLDLQTLVFQPIMPKNLPNHCATLATKSRTCSIQPANVYVCHRAYLKSMCLCFGCILQSQTRVRVFNLGLVLVASLEGLSSLKWNNSWKYSLAASTDALSHSNSIVQRGAQISKPLAHKDPEGNIGD